VTAAVTGRPGLPGIVGLSRSRAALLVVDIQDRLLPAMPAEALADVLRNTAILIEAAQRLGLPIVVSQQYPRGLGPTHASIEAAIEAARGAGADVHRFDKLEFSAAAAPAFTELASRLGRDQWILCGMETHVCVYQTARDLVARGAAVHVCADAVCSRTHRNYDLGLGLMARAGAIVTSTEVCVFDLLGRAGSDEFRALSKVIK
jgi:nicotinamidase-related amidase